MDCSARPESRHCTAVLPIMAVIGPLHFILGWPCGAEHHGQCYRVLVATYILVSFSAWISKGDLRKALFRMALFIHSIIAAAMSHSWCFGIWPWHLFVAFVLVGHYCALRTAAPGCIHLQLAFTFLWIVFHLLIPRTENGKETSLRRLQEGESETDWFAIIIIIASFTVTGVVGLTMLPWPVCCRCCCRQGTPRIAVAEDVEVENGIDESARRESAAGGEVGLQSETGFHGIVFGTPSAEHEESQEGTSQSDELLSEDSLWYSGSIASSVVV